MAKADVAEPSEDEDFDATINSHESVAVATEEAPKSSSSKTETEDAETEAPETTEEPEAPAEADDEPEADEAPVEPDKPAVAKASKPKSALSRRMIFEVVLLLAVIGLGLWSWSLYSDRQDLRKQVAQLNQNPQIAVQRQTQALLTAVGKLIQLPSGETPTVANVSDAAQAKQQSAFFNNAQNGDKVLMYAKAGEAILYRPSTGKIVLVAPLTFTKTTP